MRLVNSRSIVAIILVCFLLSGCASLFPTPKIGIDKPDLSLATYQPMEVKVVVEERKPLVQQPLRKGQVAPYDGIIFSKESAKMILADLTEYKALKIRDQINEQILALYKEQGGILRGSNDLMVQSNEQYRKEIESQRKWGTVKNWLSVFGGVAAFALGIWAAK